MTDHSKVTGYILLNDENILMHWRNPDDHTEECWLRPGYYQDCGTPICDDESNMEYVGTYLRKLT